MGDIIGGVIGGVGSLLGGSSAKSNDLTGFNYLKGNNLTQQAQNSAVGASQGQSNVSSDMAQLMGLAPMTAGATNGFNNYLNSTGYNFQMNQGQQAITGSAAARGILNSGATAKALTNYGQGLAGNSFNNYLSQLGNLGNQYGAQTNQGLQSTGQEAAAGTSGGQAAGQAMGNGINTAFNDFAGQSSNLQNFFAGPSVTSTPAAGGLPTPIMP